MRPASHVVESVFAESDFLQSRCLRSTKPCGSQPVVQRAPLEDLPAAHLNKERATTSSIRINKQ